MAGPPPIEPLQVFGSAFGVSSFAGLAALLRSGKPLTLVAVASAMLNTGLLGVAIAMIWWHKFGGSAENIYWLVGLCVLSGLGGVTVIDFVVTLAKKGGVSIRISPQASEDDNDEPKKP